MADMVKITRALDINGSLKGYKTKGFLVSVYTVMQKAVTIKLLYCVHKPVLHPPFYTNEYKMTTYCLTCCWFSSYLFNQQNQPMKKVVVETRCNGSVACLLSSHNRLTHAEKVNKKKNLNLTVKYHPVKQHLVNNVRRKNIFNICLLAMVLNSYTDVNNKYIIYSYFTEDTYCFRNTFIIMKYIL